MPKKKTGSKHPKNPAPKKRASARKMMKVPSRAQVRTADTWDLSSLFPDDEAWLDAFKKWERRIVRYADFRGHLTESAEALQACLKFHFDFDRQGERLSAYAFLRVAQDVANSTYQAMRGRLMSAAARAAEAASFMQPEILSASRRKIETLLADPLIEPYRLWLERLWRQRPHTLSEREERLLALQVEMAQTARLVFNQLNDADLRFGEVWDDAGNGYPLSHGSFQELLRSPDRVLRKRAFHRYYHEYEQHANTLAAALSGSVQRDVYYAKARNFASAREAVLFHEFIPVAVYDSLIDAVRARLPDLHAYYETRRRKLRLRQIRFYDTYVPLVSKVERRLDWDDAVSAVLQSLHPLGDDYRATLEKGLRGRWCDRYENRGKDSGAFSCGTFDGDPYILMNHKPNVLESTFTLAHEAGHSMHSFYSARSQPFQYYDYELFVAEVASTFNEQLLARWMLDQAADDHERAYLLTREIDAIRNTIFRQTMFAEFEKLTHAMAEAGEPLTVESLRATYRGLLDSYLGPDFKVDDELELECFRIPHFYRAFYVYKYATGMSAAIALADRVLGGGKPELDAYLNFLKGGCSKDPLDLLRAAGVDMERPEPVETAIQRLRPLVEELDRLV